MHTDEQGDRVYVLSWIKEAGLACLSGSRLSGGAAQAINICGGAMMGMFCTQCQHLHSAPHEGLSPFSPWDHKDLGLLM